MNEAYDEEVMIEGLSIDGSTITINSDFNVAGKYGVNCSALSWANNNYALNSLTIACDQTEWEIMELIIWTSVGVGGTVLVSFILAILLGTATIGGTCLTVGILMLRGVYFDATVSQDYGMILTVIGSVFLIPVALFVVFPTVMVTIYGILTLVAIFFWVIFAIVVVAAVVVLIVFLYLQAEAQSQASNISTIVVYSKNPNEEIMSLLLNLASVLSPIWEAIPMLA